MVVGIDPARSHVPVTTSYAIDEMGKHSNEVGDATTPKTGKGKLFVFLLSFFSVFFFFSSTVFFLNASVVAVNEVHDHW